MKQGPLAASFRDPSGFLYRKEGLLLRQVHKRYEPHYSHLMTCGLYEELASAGKLIEHEEVDVELALTKAATRVLRPSELPFISYPWEWTFGQLRDAALLTLEVHERALEHDMVLKDASAFNIQFMRGQPVLIDTLSFERYQEGSPWVAYGQFCRHFLAPLALMAAVDPGLGRLFSVYLDGIPLDLTCRLLPLRSRARLSLFLHLVLHAKAERKYAGRSIKNTRLDRRLSRKSLARLTESLRGAVQGLRWSTGPTEWADYETEHGYSERSRASKEEIVGRWLARIGPKTVWDLGANVGAFSRLAADAGARVVAFDVDPLAANRHYLQCRESGEDRILPLTMDLMNPSPAVGWAHEERDRLEDRGAPDMLLGLALIHHLAIGNNVRLGHIAAWFARLAPWAILEFVPKDDPQVGRLLQSREDIFDGYTVEGLEAALGAHFDIRGREPVEGSGRICYLVERRATH